MRSEKGRMMEHSSPFDHNATHSNFTQPLVPVPLKQENTAIAILRSLGIRINLYIVLFPACVDLDIGEPLLHTLIWSERSRIPTQCMCTFAYGIS